MTVEINGTVNEDVESYIISGPQDPTTSTVGNIGQFYKNTTTGAIFKCTAIASGAYTWKTSAASLSYY